MTVLRPAILTTLGVFCAAIVPVAQKRDRVIRVQFAIYNLELKRGLASTPPTYPYSQ